MKYIKNLNLMEFILPVKSIHKKTGPNSLFLQGDEFFGNFEEIRFMVLGRFVAWKINEWNWISKN